MTATWLLRLAYQTGSTMSPRACRAHLPPNTPLTTTNNVPARLTPSNTPTLRHTHGRTQTPAAPIRESDLSTIESHIGRALTRTLVRDPMRQGPIRSPCTPAPTHTPCTNPHHQRPSRCHNQLPSYAKRRVVHKRFPPNHIRLCITLTTPYRVGDPHTSSDHRAWEVFLHRYGCRPQCVSLIPFSLSEFPDGVVLTLFVFCFWVGHADKTVPAATEAPVYELRTLGVYLFGPLAKIQAPTSKEAPEEE